MDEHPPFTPDPPEDTSGAAGATEGLDPSVAEHQQRPASQAKPAHQAGRATEPNQPCEGQLLPERASASDRPTIVVADDSPTVRKLVSVTLESRDFHVETAEDGYHALQKIAQCQPRLVLTDINMPRIDGYQLCRMLKRHPSTRRITVVMLSANGGVFDKIRGKMVGCNDYLTKPFEPSELIRKVESYLSVGV